MVHFQFPNETTDMEYDDIQKLFGKRVKELRKRMGFSQEELAEKISKSTDTVSNIERGFTSTRIKTAASIATALDVPLKELFDIQPLSPEEMEEARLIERVAELLQPCDEAARKGAVEVLEAFVRASVRQGDG